MGVAECDVIRPAFAEAKAAVDTAQAAHDAALDAFDGYGDYTEKPAGPSLSELSKLLDAAKLARAQIWNEAGSLDWNVVHLNDGHLSCLGATACQVEDRIGLPMPAGWAERNAGMIISD